ncbi:MAG: outer membrane lipoprotein carrier protein LolA [Acetobacteraceae bacterium]|nr:outer membrane lipoprotein carrier protein LolA [Acetobacteraceae bacterium]
MARLAAVEASRARFTEEKHIAALKEPLASQGELLYRRPSHFEKITTAPIHESLMVDGGQLSVLADGRAPVLIDLASEPEIRALVDAVRGILSGDIAALRRSYAVSMTGPLSGWTLTLLPHEAGLSKLVRRIVVEGAGTELHTVRIEEPTGDASLMTISPVR